MSRLPNTRISIVLSMLFCFGLSANAQFSFGFRGGVNWTSVDVDKNPSTFSSTYSLIVAPQLAGVIRYQSTKLVAFQIEPSYVGRGFAAKTKYALMADEVSRTETMRINYLELPILGKFLIPISGKFSSFVMVGPYAGYAISGTRTIRNEYLPTTAPDPLLITPDGTSDIDFSKSSINRFDLGLVAAVGLSFDMSNGHFFMDARFSKGFLNTQSGRTNQTNFNYALGLGLGYAYGLGK